MTLKTRRPSGNVFLKRASDIDQQPLNGRLIHAFLDILLATRAPATMGTIVFTTKVKGPYPGFTELLFFLFFLWLLLASSNSVHLFVFLAKVRKWQRS